MYQLCIRFVSIFKFDTGTVCNWCAVPLLKAFELWNFNSCFEVFNSCFLSFQLVTRNSCFTMSPSGGCFWNWGIFYLWYIQLLKFMKIVWHKHNLMISSSFGSGHPIKYSYEIHHEYLSGWGNYSKKTISIKRNH